MKTIFLNKLKQRSFLLIAVLGTFIGYSQSTTTTTIGGSKTPDTGGFIDIGGNQRPTPTLLTNLTVETQCLFAFDIGGRGTSSDTGQVNDDDTDPYDIGGSGGVIIGRPNLLLGFNASKTSNYDIGGRQEPPIMPFNLAFVNLEESDETSDVGGGNSTTKPPLTLPFTLSLKETQCMFVSLNEPGGGKGTSSDTGQVNNPDDFDDLDTGGRGANTNTGEIAASDTGGKSSDGGLNPGISIMDIGGRSTGGDLTDLETGGKNSTGGLEIDCPLCPDTGGGNGGKSTTGEYAYSEIGGRDSGGGLNPLDDIGGKGGTDTGQFTIYDIGGRNTNSTGEVAVFDTGGRGNELGGGCIFDGFCLIYTPE